MTAFAITSVLLLCISLFSVYNNKQYLAASKTLRGTSFIMKDLEEVLAETREIVSGSRIYVLTGSVKSLELYETGLKNMQQTRERLHSELHENPELTAGMDSLMEKLAELEGFAKRSIEKEYSSEIQKFSVPDSGETYKQDIEGIVTRLEDFNRLRLRRGEAQQQALAIRATQINYVLAGFGFIFLCGVFIILQREFNKRKISELQLKEFNTDLAKQVGIKSAEQRSIFDRITDAFVALDNTFNYTYLNKRAGEILDADPDALIGKNMWPKFPGGSDGTLYVACLDAMAQQKYVYHEEHNAASDRWFENHLYPSPDGLSIYFRDITEKKWAELALQQSEQRYRSLVEHASDGIFISNAEGRYVDVNSSACKMLGYTREELLEMSGMQIIATRSEGELVSRYELLKAGHSYIRENQLRRKDGTLMDVETNARMMADGRFIGMVRDISERKRTEREIMESEKKYKLLFDNNPIALFMTEIPSYAIIDVNESAIEQYGYSRKQFLQMNARQLRAPEDLELFERNMVPHAVQGTNHAGRWKHRRADGSSIIVEIITHDLYYHEKPARIVLANDVTKRVKAEEDLQASYSQLRELSSHLQSVREEERANIAREIHDELGQQLTGLKMDASWIGKRVSNAPDEVHERTETMIALIDDAVKTVRRIATDLRPGILDDLGLLAALEWQCSEFEKRTGIKCNFNSSIPELDCERDVATGIFRIFQEALTNVARHSGATSVHTEVRSDDGYVTLAIQDNGRGFDPEQARRNGSLGLVGMKERALMMDGELSISSGEGGGTLIVLRAPYHKTAKA